jgi:hypothetical protein
MRTSTLLISTFLFLLLSSCEQEVKLKTGEAKATIGSKVTRLRNAQAGISRIGGGLYSSLSIVFGTSEGEGMGITLVAKKDFEEKEYKVKYVKNPAAENAQLTYYPLDKSIFEAVGSIGSGSVTLTEITDTYIKGRFSGKYVLQEASSPVIEIKDGEFNATFSPPVDEF